MKRIIVYTLLMGAMAVKADLLSDLLTKKFDAQTLTEQQTDSILNGQPTLSADEALLPQNRYVLGYENKQKMFRHSFWANYTITDTKKNETYPLTDTLVRDAQLSPNGQYIVYGKGQNLYIYKVLYKTEVPITENKDDVFNGLSDWLYEEEFDITRLFWFSPESKQIAFVRLDERSVPTFTWQTYLQQPYPMQQDLRYPKAGMPNAQASVCIYDISTKGIRTIQLPPMEDSYIPRLYWRSENELIIQRINRDQTRLEVMSANPKTTIARPLYQSQSERYYTDFMLFDEWQWLSDGRFVVLDEKNGWKQLTLYSSQGAEQSVLTPQGIDVTAIYGVDEKAGVVYYQAAPKATERQVYAVAMKTGKITQLTEGDGMHALTFSKDMKRAIDCYQSISTAPQYTLYTVAGSKWQATKSTALDAINATNSGIAQAWAATGLPNKQLLRIPTERGDTLDAWVILPNGLKSLNEATSQRYPVVMMQYSGPQSQRVLNQWRHRFGHYLAGQGYIVVNADPRGTDNRGRAWRNATYLQLGQKEAEDHISVARYMQSLPTVDGQRIAMMGWSYGGFQTIYTMCMQDQMLIKCGIAIAPVTDWRLYDSAYTERYMRRPQVNEDGYEATDLTKMADRLQGQLLLVHSTGDDNVHFQQSLKMIDALVKAGKDFDTQIYVDDNHSLLNAANNDHLHRKILTYLQENL